MMKNNIMDYEQDELETVDSYIHQTHFEDAPFYNDEINGSDEASIDRLLRRSSMRFTRDVLENIEKKFIFKEFAEDDDLNDQELLKVFGSKAPEEIEKLQDNDISLTELHTVYRKAA